MFVPFSFFKGNKELSISVLFISMDALRYICNANRMMFIHLLKEQNTVNQMLGNQKNLIEIDKINLV